MRRKSFSLVLLILIVVLVVFLVILSIFLINKSSNKKSEKEKNNTENEVEISQTDDNSNVLDSSFFESLDVIDNASSNSTENNSDNNENDVVSENTEPEENILTLNNHSYKFDNSTQATIKNGANNTSEFDITYSDKIYKLSYGTDSTQTFEDLKGNSDLKDFIENTYNVSVTSALKQGNVANLDLIICTISEENKKAYFLFTPLNANEIAYAKIYNSVDEQSLINDLSDPLNSVSSIISSIQ